VFDLAAAARGAGRDANATSVATMPANEVESRSLEGYRKAFEKRCAS